MLPKELDHEDGELTATQKLKRDAMTDTVRRARGVDVPMSVGAVAAAGRRLVAQPDADRRRGVTASTSFVHTLAKGLAQGALYALVALGFVLIFKATQTVNFAQGAIALVGAWFASLLLIDWEIPGRWMGDNTYVDLDLGGCCVALVLTAVLGLIIERLAIRPMIGEPLFSIAVITLGLEAILRTIGFDAVNLNNREPGDPVGLRRLRHRRGVVPWTYVAIYIATAIAFVAIFLFFRTRPGIAMRAVAFDQEAALAQGISVGKVFAVAWGAGAALAALAGVLARRCRRSASGPSAPASPALGLPRPAGRDPRRARLGQRRAHRRAADRLRRGVLRRVPRRYTDTLGNGYPLIVPYVVMLVVLLVRPYGLFGTPEIRRV